jgi:outer membrane protein assembly complex protein YaeT
MPATDRLRCPVSRIASAALAGLLLCTAAILAQTTAVPLARKVLIEDIKWQGNLTIPTQRIVPYIKTRAGQEYNEDAIQEDIKNLYATKLFGNVQASKQETADGNVILIFSVVEAPSRIENIRYEGGGHLKISDLESLTNLKRGQPMNPVINRRACQEIVRRLNDDGWPLAACELLKGDKPGDTEVVFNITEGPRIRVKDIEFVGNHFVSDGVLATHVNSSKMFLSLPLGGKFNAAMADADVIKLEEYYRSYGFVDARVSRELQLSGDASSVTLVFHIHEGERYRVEGTQVEGHIKAFPREEIDRLPKSRPGEFINEIKIKQDEKAIKDYYGWKGIDVTPRTRLFYPEDQPGVARVVYEIPQEPTQKRLGPITVIGNDVTRQNVILRELPFYPGQILPYPEIRRAEANLARLGIFEVNQEGVRPHIEIEDVPGSDFVNANVYVQETKTGSLLFGLGVTSDAGLTGSIVLNERNFDISRVPTSWDDFLSGRAFRGAGQELRIEAVPGTLVQRYSATFREPRLFDSLFSLTVGGYYFTRSYTEYTEERLGTRITVGRRINQTWLADVGVRVENVGVHNVPPQAPQTFQSVVGDNFLAGFRAGVTRDTRDSYLRPTEGSKVTFTFEEVTGDFTFPVGTVEANKYFTVWQRADGSGRHVLALRSLVAVAGTHAPVFERFYAGGFHSIRGFQFRGVGPTENGFEVGGDFMFLNSLEYQVPIKANDQIYLVGFVDSGTVEQNVEIKNYRVSAGFGIRFVVPMLGPVPIALDFGFPIVKKDGDKEQVFSFQLGWTY